MILSLLLLKKAVSLERLGEVVMVENEVVVGGKDREGGKVVKCYWWMV